jgi:hypothetical protein
MTNPVEGREDEYNEWYSDVHIQEVVDIPGFISAQRFALSPSQMGGQCDYRYLALYEIEADDVKTALDNLKAARPNLRMSDALDRNVGAWAFTPITDKLEQGG